MHVQNYDWQGILINVMMMMMVMMKYSTPLKVNVVCISRQGPIIRHNIVHILIQLMR